MSPYQCLVSIEYNCKIQIKTFFSCGCQSVRGVDLKSPRCNDPQRSLQSKGMHTRVRMVLDVKDYYYLTAEHHFCSCCKVAFTAWDARLLEQLSDDI